MIMARYKLIEISQTLLQAVLADQLVPGSFAHALLDTLDTLDLPRFDAHYRNNRLCFLTYTSSVFLKA
jgi:hypothetical protein